MVRPSHHHRTAASSTFRQQLGRLADAFDRLAEQQTEQESVRKRDADALFDSLRKGVEQLHAHIEELEKAGLWRRQSYFNLFDVIERTHCEHAHSNILAWLLDPAQAHGLKDAFLRAFVKAVFDEDLDDTTGVVVKREYGIGPGYCDIVVWRRADWVLVIENKIASTQGKDQLHKYVQYWRQRPFHKSYFVFLTRDDERPNCKDFVRVSFHTVRKALMDLHGSEGSEILIRHFVDHIWFA
jgi:hypothetical protein